VDVGIFHVVDKYELLQKQARVEFEAELLLSGSVVRCSEIAYSWPTAIQLRWKRVEDAPVASGSWARCRLVITSMHEEPARHGPKYQKLPARDRGALSWKCRKCGWMSLVGRLSMWEGSPAAKSSFGLHRNAVLLQAIRN
jgi:hypothetical protein